MRSHYHYYPNVRRNFQNAGEIADIINRSVAYVGARLTGKKEFTARDKRMILEYMGKPVTEMDNFFIREVTA